MNNFLSSQVIETELLRSLDIRPRKIIEWKKNLQNDAGKILRRYRRQVGGCRVDLPWVHGELC